MFLLVNRITRGFLFVADLTYTGITCDRRLGNFDMLALPIVWNVAVEIEIVYGMPFGWDM